MNVHNLILVHIDVQHTIEYIVLTAHNKSVLLWKDFGCKNFCFIGLGFMDIWKVLVKKQVLGLNNSEWMTPPPPSQKGEG